MQQFSMLCRGMKQAEALLRCESMIRTTLSDLPLLCLIRISSRCMWDADTDNYAEDVFMNVGVFGLVTQIWQFRGKISFFTINCVVFFTFVGQLVLCGGCFWKLLLLRKNNGRVIDIYRIRLTVLTSGLWCVALNQLYLTIECCDKQR